jgi:transcriptional regulator GlxA family with amidase domain
MSFIGYSAFGERSCTQKRKGAGKRQKLRRSEGNTAYYLKEALRMIDERYAEKLSAASIAKEFVHFRNQFCKLFARKWIPPLQNI